jgi:hypothetical protein
MGDVISSDELRELFSDEGSMAAAELLQPVVRLPHVVAPTPGAVGHVDVERLAGVLFTVPGLVYEVRAIGEVGGNSRRTDSGYFDNPSAFVREVMKLDGRFAGVYFAINPVRSDLMARAANRIQPWAKQTTADSDVPRRARFFIDLDPTRPSGISATDEQVADARAVRDEVVRYLSLQGFPEPILADSGNGAHALYETDLPAADNGLIDRVLAALAFRFDTETVTVDQTVHTPAHLGKVYGTIAKKGDSLPDRPHRRSRITHLPEHLVQVPRNLLELVAVPAPTLEPVPAAGVASTGSFDLEQLLASGRVSVERSGPWKGGTRWILNPCPFNSEHTNGAAYVVRDGSGWIGAGCHHNGCKGKKWHDLRRILEPGWEPARGASVTFVSVGGGPCSVQWPEPEPLREELPPVPAFDPSLLPDRLRPWIVDIANRMQCPMDFPAVAAVVVLSSVLGRKIAIRPKRRDSWQVVPNLWGAVVGRPSVLKTPAIQEAMRMLLRLETRAQEENTCATARHEAQLMAWNSQHRAKTSRNKVISEEAAAALIATRPTLPPRRRYHTNDATVEKLGELLRDSPNGILTFRDELVGLLHNLDREGQEGSRAFYLEAWNGTSGFVYDRIGRGTIDIPAAVVSVLGGIQPGPLRAYVSGAAREGKADDGLIQRFQLTVWPDISSTWINVDEWPNTEAKRVAFDVFRELDAITPEQAKAENGDPDDRKSIPYLRFAPDAQEEFVVWLAGLEHWVRGDTEPPPLEAHFGKYRSLVPSLALLFHLIDGGIGPVSVAALRRAIAWAKFLEAHARRLHAIAFDRDAAPSRVLAKKLLAGALRDGFGGRDVYRKNWSGINGQEDAEAALKHLEDLDWLRRVETKTSGRTKLSYLINPRIHELENGGVRAALPDPVDPTSVTSVSEDLLSHSVHFEQRRVSP